VRPKGITKLPAVIVIHENRGLNAHIEDITRRVALEGFLAFGPDLLSPAGGTPANEDTARDMIGTLDGQQTVQNLVAAVAFLAKHAHGPGKSCHAVIFLPGSIHWRMPPPGSAYV
jgi:carboxymethylenebutenolidase